MIESGEIIIRKLHPYNINGLSFSCLEKSDVLMSVSVIYNDFS